MRECPSRESCPLTPPSPRLADPRPSRPPPRRPPEPTTSAIGASEIQLLPAIAELPALPDPLSGAAMEKAAL
jgi:hypothetical protein